LSEVHLKQKDSKSSCYLNSLLEYSNET